MTTPSARPRWVRLAELTDNAAPAVLDSGGRPVDPLWLVDLDEVPPPPAVAAAAEVARRGDRILVGVRTRDAPDPTLSPLTDALDLTLARFAPGRQVVRAPDPVRSAVALHEAVTANPHASTVLAGLLRWSGALRVADALDAESFAYSTLLGGPEFLRWLQRRGPRPPPPQATDPVLVTRDGGTLRITLNRPRRRNAYGRQVRDGVVAALAVAERDTTVERVVLDGGGPSFCSGGDLDEFGTAPDLVTAHLVRTRGGAALPLHRLADRVEAHVHGPCVGAGVELPAFARRVIAAHDTTLRLPEVMMGLVPGAGGTVAIPRRIGRWRTLHLALSGVALTVGTALEWGLVDEIRPLRT